MADRKISDLTALTTPASGDFLPIVDISEAAAASKNKRITIEELMRGVPDGTAAAPGIAFETDPNTGIYRPGADQLAVATNGTGRLFVDASGNVGVGGSPSHLLDCRASSTPTIRVLETTNGPDGRFLASASDVQIGSYGGSPFCIYTNSTEKVRVTTGGLVGIGTSQPVGQTYIAGPNTSNFGVAADAALNIAAASGALANRIINLNFAVVPSATNAVAAIGMAYGSQSGFGNGHLIFGTRSVITDTAPTERMRIDSSGRVGIGTTSPNEKLDVRGKLYLNNGSASYFDAASSGGLIITNPTAVRWEVNSSERARIDSSGRLLVGTSTAIGSFQFAGSSRTSGCQIVGDTIDNGSFAVVRTTTGPVIYMGAGTSGLNVAANDALGYQSFHGYHTNAYYEGARITAHVDSTPGAGDMPGRLVFSTTADGASSPTERMRIANDGEVQIGLANPSNRSFLFTRASSNTVAYFDRQTNDGTIIEFRQNNTTEGTISVSGTTVSYNGGHLSRWSQLPSGAERTEILRGSVLANIDEMCEWGDEENEQLNRMKVSDVEGDKNVSGVFQAWDDDDDTYTDDFYCAMTGDFIIRIAEGVTVERGDLLMSAGDGTAKPQDDDIIRSKTIAKVTSTNVSCTYADGSYCVPCVLMAC